MAKIKKLTITDVLQWGMNWDGDFSKIPAEHKRTTVLLAVELENGQYLSENNQIIRPAKCRLIEAKQTRLDPEVRSLMEDMYKTYLKSEQLREKIHSLENELRDANSLRKELSQKIITAKGLLSLMDFGREVLKHFSPALQTEIREKGYEFDTPYGLCYQDNKLYLSRRKDIQKYYHGSLVFQEYDGKYFMVDHPEKQKAYRDYIKMHSKPLHVKGKLLEDLALGDKDMLYYTACYEIYLREPLTKEYAHKIAKQFEGGKI